MTNNPDSKAPERIWASAGSYPKFDDKDWCNASCSDQIEFGVEYTRTDAITPQQAAKVLFESMMGDDYQMSATTMDMFLDALHSETNRAKMFFAALKALAESKDD